MPNSVPNSAPNSAFVKTITERGYMHQATNLDALDEVAGERCIPAYIGFDCTADSLHIGSLVWPFDGDLQQW